MAKLRKVSGLLFVAGFVMFQGFMGNAYANNGQGQGQGQGQGKGQGQGQGVGNVKVKSMGKSAAKSVKANKARFGFKDKSIIKNYYKATPFQASPLPPGIAKNLLRGKPLPPGIAKVFLPSGLLSELPVYPGYEYLAIGRDVVLVNTTTEIVADILSNVLQ